MPGAAQHRKAASPIGAAIFVRKKDLKGVAKRAWDPTLIIGRPRR